ncbi:hypothetical protein AB0D10_16050 [Kitasatospora sp. NPDC048545]|uniref:hypothetical protein n=1 Tax=Kitasatospora sp. NPDC048545 TaxID=3157208 RepID=UPI0033D39735
MPTTTPGTTRTVTRPAPGAVTSPPADPRTPAAPPPAPLPVADATTTTSAVAAPPPVGPAGPVVPAVAPSVWATVVVLTVLLPAALAAVVGHHRAPVRSRR